MLEEDYNHTEYVFGNTSSEFDDSFSLGTGTLHEALFGVVNIILFRRLNNSKKAVGVIKVRLKQFMEKTFPPELCIKVLPPSFLRRADFYGQEESAIGDALLNFTVTPFPNTLMVVHPAPFPRMVLDFFKLEERMRIYKIIFELFAETQRGTILCRIHWVLGLLSAEHYYSQIYKTCEDGQCDPGKCEKQFCPSSYRNIPPDILEEGQILLQYAAASFANSIILWRLRKPRTMPHISNSRLRAILERLGIEEVDLYKDRHGTEDGLAFIAFFIKERMIVSFKGTTNGLEAMHDLNCEYVSFQDGYAHNGILKLARKFIKDDWPNLHDEMGRRGVTKILLTGHSLGAAACTLVYLILQESGLEDSLDIEVVGFGGPPIVSASIAKRKQPKIRMFIFGADIVSRMNFGSVLDLKYICISISSLYDYFTDKARIIKKVEEIKKYLSETGMYTKLYHVGMLYHIKGFKCGKKTTYLYKQVEPEFFEDLISIKQAPFDHFIHNLYKAFTQNGK